MKTRTKVIGAIGIILVIVMSLGFVTAKKSKLENDIKIICSKTWIPMRHSATGFSEPAKDLVINYGTDHSYTLKVLPTAGVTMKGDSLMKGTWEIDNDRKIHVDCYGTIKSVSIVKVNENEFVIETNDNGRKGKVYYTASIYTPIQKQNPFTAAINKLIE